MSRQGNVFAVLDGEEDDEVSMLIESIAAKVKVSSRPSTTEKNGQKYPYSPDSGRRADRRRGNGGYSFFSKRYNGNDAEQSGNSRPDGYGLENGRADGYRYRAKGRADGDRYRAKGSANGDRNGAKGPDGDRQENGRADGDEWWQKQKDEERKRKEEERKREKEAYEERKRQREEDAKKKTLKQYEEIIEKNKALGVSKSQERKITLDKDFESMQVVTKNKEGDIFIKLNSDKDKLRKKDSVVKDVKMHKTLSINEFLKQREEAEAKKEAEAQWQKRQMQRGGYGGRGGGQSDEGSNGELESAPAMKSPPPPPIEDLHLFPTLRKYRGLG